MTLGDSVCAFNPVYGQGMTVSALEAMLLQKYLLKAGVSARAHISATNWENSFQKKLYRLLQNPWTLATSEDMRIYSCVCTGTKKTVKNRFLHWFLDQILKASVSNTHVHETFLSVVHMLKEPSALFSPRILSKIRPYSEGGRAACSHDVMNSRI